MEISKEKEHLYQIMKSLLDERRIITEEVLEIRTRINKLNDMQEIGIRDIPTVDYIQLRNTLNEAKYEAAKTALKNEQKEFEIEDAIPAPIKITTNIKRKAPSFERTMSVVIDILKESGRPLDTKEIKEHIESELDFVFNGNRLGNTLWRIKKENSKVTQPSRGFYQYTM